MVLQRLTSELTQPSCILVEIDHGPPMGLYEEDRWPAPEPEAQLPDAICSVKEASVSKSSCRGPGGDPTACDMSPKPSSVFGGIAVSIKMDTDGTRTGVLKDGGVKRPEGFSTLWQPSWPHCSEFGPAVQDAGEGETVVIGMHHLPFEEPLDPLSFGPCPMGKSPGDVGSHPEGVLERISLDTPHSADAALRSHLKSVTRPIRITTIPNSVSVADGNCPCGRRRPVEIPPNSRQILSECVLQGDHNEKWMAEADRSVVLGKQSKHLHYDLPNRDIRNGRLCEMQPFDEKDVMSWAAGSKATFMFEAEEISREILMWMIEYNMMTSHSDTQKLVALAHQSVGHLLTVMEAAVSCLRILLPHQLERNARDKQWTGEVHCLLDDPG